MHMPKTWITSHITYLSWLKHIKAIDNMIYHVPSGKLLHNYGKSPFFMGKSTINGHFQVAILT